jgi:uncharacterized phage infection (PIP) family protein YhgE
MTLNQADHLEVLAVTLVDIRAAVDAQKRAVTNAQASIEQFRHTRAKASLDDIAGSLKHLSDDGRAVAEAAAEADSSLRAIVSGLHALPPRGSTPGF